MRMSSIIGLFLVFMLSFSLFCGCASNSGPSDSDSDPDPVPLPDPDPSINIFISQVETECFQSGAIEVRVHASVIDEFGDPIDALNLNNFSVYENATLIADQNIVFTENAGEEITTPNSVAILMDYSGSITEATETKADMEDAVLNFINLMKDNDRAAILKFNSGIVYQQDFTADKSLLELAVSEPVDGGHTYLYDSLYESIELAANESVDFPENRRAVVAITDGEESHPDTLPPSEHTVEDVIALSQSNDIPVFIIGLGTEINVDVLESIADGSSGHYYQVASRDELLEIYAKISQVLNTGQYTFVFDSVSSGQGSGSLTISVEHQNMIDDAVSNFTYCTMP